MTATAYVLHDPTDPDRHFWLIAGPERAAAWMVDGQPLDRHLARYGRTGPWFTGPAGGTLVGRKADTSRVIGYRLRDADAASVRFPTTLTPEEWSERTADYDDTADAPEYALYDRVAETIPGETFTVDTVIDLGDGSPAPQDSLTWNARLPYELQHHPELLHRFPGHFAGFRAAVIAEAKQLPFMAPGLAQSGARMDDDQPGHVMVYTTVPYEPHTTRLVYHIGQKLKRGKRVTDTKRLEISIQVPDRIEGPDRAAAREAWDRELARILAEITDALTAVPCGHCKGTGIVARREAVIAP